MLKIGYLYNKDPWRKTQWWLTSGLGMWDGFVRPHWSQLFFQLLPQRHRC